MKPYYEHGGITIYHGDCADILPLISSVDLLLTDPPYGLNMASKGKIGSPGPKGIEPTQFLAGDWDKATPDRSVIDLSRSKATHQIIFGGNFFHLPPSSCWLVWDKDNSGDFADCELAWTNLKKAVRKIQWRWNGMLQEDMANKELRTHPTQKPLAVIKWAIGQAPSGIRTVLDPFMGSGTTLRAAKDLGFIATGIDMDERYCEMAAKRMAQECLPL